MSFLEIPAERRQKSISVEFSFAMVFAFKHHVSAAYVWYFLIKQSSFLTAKDLLAMVVTNSRPDNTVDLSCGVEHLFIHIVSLWLSYRKEIKVLMKGQVSRISVDKSGHPHLCLFGPEPSPSERNLPKNIGHQEIHPNFTATIQLGQSDM